MTKLTILITQGDPLMERVINAIARLVAREMGVKRCLVFFDGDINPEDLQLGDRHDMVYELKYLQLVDILNEKNGGC